MMFRRCVLCILLVFLTVACSKTRAPQADAHEASADAEAGGDVVAPDDAQASHILRVSAKAIQTSGIRVGTATNGSITGALEVSAAVDFNKDKLAHISPLVDGQLVSVKVGIGDAVKAGDALAVVRSVALGEARADLALASSQLKIAQTNLQREQKLRKEGINAKKSLLNATFDAQQARARRDAARSRLRVYGVSGGQGAEMTLRSPIDGVVVQRHATRGENISTEDTPFVIADLSRVWVLGQVYEQSLAQVHKGMDVTLVLNAYPAKIWQGTINVIGDALDEQTHTLPIRVVLDNPDGLLRPGLYGTLRVASSDEGESAVIVPSEAIQTVKDKTVVFVPGEQPGEFKIRPVVVGAESRHHAQIIRGVKAGESLVVSGAFVLKSAAMSDEIGDGHAH